MSPQVHDARDAKGHVRPMERHDLPVVSSLIEKLARHHGDQPRIDLASLEADLFAPTPWVHGLVVERFGYVVGYAMMTPRYQAQFTQRGLDLHHLFVIEGSRGLGLGKALVQSVVAYARQADCGFLRVGAQAGNRHAQAFYGALGFQVRDHEGKGFAMSLQ